MSSFRQLQAEMFSARASLPKRLSCSAGLRFGQLLRFPRTSSCIHLQTEDGALFSNKMHAFWSSRKSASGCTSGTRVRSAIFLDLKSPLFSMNMGTPSSILEYNMKKRKNKYISDGAMATVVSQRPGHTYLLYKHVCTYLPCTYILTCSTNMYVLQVVL